jgi:fucose 4-O-acetylase-like acetyltransferase
MELILIVCLFCFGIWVLSQLYSRFSLFRKGFILFVVLYSVLKTNVLTVGAAPWYLMALIWFHIFVYLTRNMKPQYVLAMAVLASAFINYHDAVGKFLTLSRAVNFLPFFLMGFYMKREHFEKIVNHPKWKPFLSILFLLSAVAITLNGRAIKKWIGVFFFGVSPYSKLLKLGDWYYHMAPLTCILWIGVTVAILFGLFTLCPRGKTFLAKLGRNTIGIYILHRLFKDFLIYGGFYDILSKNEYIAVTETLLISLLLTVIFGTDFWAKTMNKLSVVNTKWVYKKDYQKD